MQVRGTLGDQVRHSNLFYATVFNSINAVDAFPPPLPSEFEQMEDRLTDINNNPPKPGTNGTWLIFNPDSGEYEESDIPLPEGGGGGYRIGHGLLLDRETNTLSVNAVSDFEGDNTLPITAAAVQDTVGNIEILLGIRCGWRWKLQAAKQERDSYQIPAERNTRFRLLRTV